MTNVYKQIRIVPKDVWKTLFDIIYVSIRHVGESHSPTGGLQQSLNLPMSNDVGIPYQVRNLGICLHR
jgi:hypothetical protein